VAGFTIQIDAMTDGICVETTTPIASTVTHHTLVVCQWGGLVCAMLCFRIGFGKKLRARLDLLTPWCQPTGWTDESHGVFIKLSGSQISQGLHHA
jgi:hypothetical protein